MKLNEAWFASRGVPHFWVGGELERRTRQLRISPTIGAIVSGSMASIALFTTPRTTAHWIGIIVALALGIASFCAAGLPAVFGWAWRDLSSATRRASGLISQGLPLLLVLSLFSFLAAEPWQTVGRARGIAYGGLQLTMFFVGAFFVSRTNTDDDVPSYPSREALIDALGSDAHLAEGVGDDAFPLTPPPLTRQERHNLIFTQVVRATIVGVLMAASVAVVLLAVSFFAIDLDTTRAWVGSKPYVIMNLHFDGRSHVITSELLHVAGFIAVFCGMASTANALGSSTIDSALEDEKRQNRDVLLAARAILAHSRLAATTS